MIFSIFVSTLSFVLAIDLGPTPQTCKHGSKEFDLKKVEETKDFSGRIVCKDSSEKPVNEVIFKTGVVVAHTRYVGDGGKTVTEFDEQGKETGAVKTYFPTGKFKEGFYRVEGQPTTKLSFDENGRLTSLKCGRESVVPQDREFCGFREKLSNVSIYQGDKVFEKASYLRGEAKNRTQFHDDGSVAREEKLNGKKANVKVLHKSGKIKSQFVTDNDIMDGKEIEFYENGTKSRESIWSKGKELRRTTFFMNGKTQKRISFENKSGRFTAQVDEYFDKGNIRSNGKFYLKDTTAWWPTSKADTFTMIPLGLHKIFSEHGKLKLETNYDDKGSRLTEKEYDQMGKLIRDEKK